MKNTLRNLVIYRNLLDDKIINGIIDGQLDKPAYIAKIINIAERQGLSGQILEQYILMAVAKDDNIFSRMADQGLNIGSSLADIVLQDIKILQNFIKELRCEIKNKELYINYHPGRIIVNLAVSALSDVFLNEQINGSVRLKLLSRYYYRNSYGLMAEYQAFSWRKEQGLIGLRTDNINSFEQIVGYDDQKQRLKENTQAFLNNLPANNVLLYGERGTGKSSSIKALIPEFAEYGLRLVEISKEEFSSLPDLMSELKEYGCKFILVLDDLSFEGFEVEYKQLKSYIEGALEEKPDNVIIYATSNRRNLISESWKDQQGDEIHITDTINEKISLADRFGLKIFYHAPSQDEFLNIIVTLAAEMLPDMNFEDLKQEAIKWERRSSGRSGRTARNFINYLLSNNTTTNQ